MPICRDLDKPSADANLDPSLPSSDETERPGKAGSRGTKAPQKKESPEDE